MSHVSNPNIAAPPATSGGGAAATTATTTSTTPTTTAAVPVRFSPSPSPAPFATPVAPPKKMQANEWSRTHGGGERSSLNSALAGLSALSASPPPPPSSSPSPSSTGIPSNRQSPSLLPPKKMQKNFSFAQGNGTGNGNGNGNGHSNGNSNGNGYGNGNGNSTVNGNGNGNHHHVAAHHAETVPIPSNPVSTSKHSNGSSATDGTKRKRAKDGADGNTKKPRKSTRDPPERVKFQKVLQFLQANDMKKWKLELTGVDLSEKTEYGPLADALKVNTSATVLYLAHTKMTAEGAGAIADALKTNKSLIEISFWHCPMGVDGAKKIAEMLEVNSTLAQLWMPGCKVGDEGACILAKSLKTNPTLSHLYLADNNIGEDGAKELASAIVSPTSKLVQLNLTNNSKLSQKTLGSVEQLLSQKESKKAQSALYQKLFGDQTASTTSSPVTKPSLLSKSPSPSPS
eukprot:TRINITY_DN1275_c0_g1_i1.p1 TRINITY_DN1275_c0_g1~~TRINITY_DN1275_c0_g1_i1.p1  ORF type:complete len:457 (+),score=127.99 TRINITY_DN1275_c0_g1_i1:116-1486(+)